LLFFRSVFPYTLASFELDFVGLWVPPEFLAAPHPTSALSPQAFAFRFSFCHCVFFFLVLGHLSWSAEVSFLCPTFAVSPSSTSLSFAMPNFCRASVPIPMSIEASHFRFRFSGPPPSPRAILTLFRGRSYPMFLSMIVTCPFCVSVLSTCFHCFLACGDPPTFPSTPARPPAFDTSLPMFVI